MLPSDLISVYPSRPRKRYMLADGTERYCRCNLFRSYSKTKRYLTPEELNAIRDEMGQSTVSRRGIAWRYGISSYRLKKALNSDGCNLHVMSSSPTFVLTRETPPRKHGYQPYSPM